MSIAPLIQVATADPAGAATPIMADALNPPLHAPPVTVTLSVEVAQLCPPGWPSPPSETGVGPVKWYPHTIPSGTTITTITTFACVAAALIAATAATLA